MLRAGLVLWLVYAAATAADRPIAADHHVHLMSAAAAERVVLHIKAAKDPLPPDAFRLRPASEYLLSMDRAGVRKAVVFSAAYMASGGDREDPDERPLIEAENRWLAEQIRPYKRRLIGFCSVNPLRAYAPEVLDQCHKLGLRGLKLHLGAADMKFGDPGHVDRLRRVFARADELRLPIVIHLRSSREYGAQQARIFLREVLPAARHVSVQIAHMGGWGGYDAGTDEALGTIASACAEDAVLCKKVYFDLSATIPSPEGEHAPYGTAQRITFEMRRMYPQGATQLPLRIRQLGVRRILFGTDWPAYPPGEYRAIVERLPLQAAELDRIFRNEAPYLRQ